MDGGKQVGTAYHRQQRRRLDSSSAKFELHVRDSNAELFSGWAERGERFLLAMDITKFMMEGMARGQLSVDNTDRIPLLVDYLADRLEEIFEEGDTTAIARHAAKQ